MRPVIVCSAASLGGCPRIEAVARESPFGQIFRSFEANSGDYLTKMIGKSDQKGFSAVGSLFSDSLLGVPLAVSQ